MCRTEISMNDQTSDPVFESLLEELLTGQHPPDLSSKILQAWRCEQAARGEPLRGPQELGLPAVKAIPISAPPLAVGQSAGSMLPLPHVAAAAMASSATASENAAATELERVELNRQQSSVMAERAMRGRVALALAGCAAGLLLALNWYANRPVTEDLANLPTENASIAQAATPAGNPAAGPVKDVVDDVVEGSSAAGNLSAEKLPQGKLPEEKRSSGQVLALDDLPFSVAPNSEPSPSQWSSELDKRVEPLPSRQLVSQLNGLFDKLWTDLGVVPTPRFEQSEQVQRISLALTGAPLSDAQMQWWNSPRTADDLLKASWETTSTSRFSQRWAEMFADQWTLRGELSADGREASELKQFLADSIEANRPWNEVVLELLGAELTSLAVTPAADASAPSNDSIESNDANNRVAHGATSKPELSFMAALAGGENHRLVERVGLNFLDTNLACARCHDGKLNPSRRLDEQETYWSLVTLLKGIDVRPAAEEGARELVDQQFELFANGQSASVFFDLPNGVLKASEARLPDGQPWEVVGKATPRQALAAWISRSPEFDRASVNQVWKFVFGRPLVPQSVGLENAAVAERTAALELLANQFRAHNYDLKLLVSWIVNSRPFSVQPINLNKSQWLAATDVELDQIQLTELVFAAGPTLGRSPEAQSLEASLAAAVEWNRRDSGEYRSMLAQPASSLAPPPATGSAPAAQMAASELPSLGYAIHGERQARAQRNFVNRLLRAERLSWEERVEHVVGLSSGEVASSRIQHLAKVLLEQNSGDAKAALLRLLWAVQNSDAG
jgi:hypothetical protein